MLQIDRYQDIGGVAVYADHASPTVYYAVPQHVTIRTDDKGRPIFKYLKYKKPIPIGPNENGGGFATFDTALVLTDAQRTEILRKLKEQTGRDCTLGAVTWAAGTASLNLSNMSNEFITKVWNPIGPSLFGDNITPFTLQMPDYGATLFAEALSGAGGSASVSYDLSAWVRLPPIVGHGRFHSEKFRSFTQSARDDAGWGSDKFTNNIAEVLRSNEVITVDIEPGFGGDQTMVNKISESIFRTVLDVATKRMAEQIEGYTGDRTVLEDYEHINRSFTNLRIEDFEMKITQATSVLWPFRPGGTMPNITTLVDKEGQPIRWEDYYSLVDLDDPFFKSISIPVRVNASFDKTVHSVDVRIEYQGDDLESADYHFAKADQLERFTCFRKGDAEEVQVAYQVNYKDTAAAYNAPMKPHKGALTINVGDLGVLAVEVHPGNLDFSNVTSATVTVAYQPTHGPELQEQIVLTKDAKDIEPIQWVILEQRERPVRYRVDYQMISGQVIPGEWKESGTPRIYVNSPFTATRLVNVFAAGDLTNTIDSVFIDLTYEDAANDYTQAKTDTLNAAKPFLNWPFPVRDADAGTVRYSGLVRYKDGRVREIAPATADDNTIVVGDNVAALVKVVPDLIDWTTVALVKVTFSYEDGTRTQTRSAVVRKGEATSTVFFTSDDPTRTTFTWSATYYLADGTSHSTPPVTTSETDVMLPRLVSV